MLPYESYRNKLIHKPVRQWEQDPIDIVNQTFSETIPTFSIVMPIHNQQEIIADVLTSVVTYTLGTYEMILILDGCTDGTKNKVTDWLQTASLLPTLVKIWVLENPVGIFETSCDNQGFVASRGSYIVEIQADMVMMTLGYNLILSTPMEIYEDIMAVSGRCCHMLNYYPGFTFGKTGELTKKPHRVLNEFEYHNKVFVTHTANRGPIVFRKSMLEQMGFLDEAHYVLGDDEHDLFMRAYCDHRWRVGFVPVEVYSPSEWGSTRKPMPSSVRAYLTMRENNIHGGFMTQNRNFVQFDAPQIRDLPLHSRQKALTTLMYSDPT